MLMEYRFTVSELPRDQVGQVAPKLVSHETLEGFVNLYQKLTAYGQIWNVQVPTPQFIEAHLAHAFDPSIGWGEVSFQVDLGLFSPNVHVLTILASD